MYVCMYKYKNKDMQSALQIRTGEHPGKPEDCSPKAPHLKAPTIPSATMVLKEDGSDDFAGQSKSFSRLCARSLKNEC